MAKIANFFNWNMRETPSKMHMHDMVTIDTTFLEIVGGGGGRWGGGELLDHPDRIGLI